MVDGQASSAEPRFRRGSSRSGSVILLDVTRTPKTDNRKRYPTGTRGSVEINAHTDEPQTASRGEEFSRIIGDTMVEARATLDERLRTAGFQACVTISNADLEYWFDGDIAEWRE